MGGRYWSDRVANHKTAWHMLALEKQIPHTWNAATREIRFPVGKITHRCATAIAWSLRDRENDE